MTHQALKPVLFAVLASALAFGTEGAMAAQDDQDSPEVAALKEAKAQAALKSEIAAAKLKTLQDEAAAAKLSSPDPVAQGQAEAAARTAAAKEKQAAAEAEVAAINADAARAKARIGSVSGSTFTGAVESDASAGKNEATLLAARSVELAAVKVAQAAIAANTTVAASGKKSFILLGGATGPQFGNYRAYQLRVTLVEAGLNRASTQFQKVEAQRIKLAKPPTRSLTAGTESVAAITTIGTVIDLAAKLGSYIQSDYKIAGSAVAGVDDDLLVASTAGALLAGGHSVWIPAQVLPMDPTTGVADDLKTTAGLVDTAAANLALAEGYSSDLKAAAEKFPAAQEKDKKAYLAVAALYDSSATQTKAAIKAYEDLLAALGAEDKDGAVLVNKIHTEKVTYQKLQAGAALVLVSVKSSAGGNFSKKNLWTFMGTMPFYVSGGTVVKYTVHDGKTGAAIAAGQVRLTSDYKKLHEVVVDFSEKPPAQ